MNTIPRLMIAAPCSGSGKSVITSGLMAAFSARFPVQGYKVGPDYIDPMYHTLATGRPSRNLDGWMLSQEVITRLFVRAARGSSLSIIEGVMGLFDGYDSNPLLASSAALAVQLSAPIVLAVDCARMSGSAAALVKGFHTFLPQVQLSGVICNRVGSAQHANWLREIIERETGLPVLGCIPRLDGLRVPERHLGLFTVPERENDTRVFLQQAAGTLSEYLDLDRILAIARSAPDLPEVADESRDSSGQPVRLGVARDEAFCFYYEDNLDELRRAGAEIVPFSPLNDQSLPEDISGIYFGGGYPELYPAQLSANAGIREQITGVCRKGMPVYAECGGLMYLTQGIRDAQGAHPLVGAVPGWCEMGDRLTMGYREVETIQNNLLAGGGEHIRGHEFHYSRWEGLSAEEAIYRIQPRGNKPDGPLRLEGYASGNVQASYVHLHFSQNPSLAQSFVNHCRKWQLTGAPEGTTEGNSLD